MSETMTVPDNRPGDLFRWHWREGVKVSSHCRSHLAVVTPRGYMVDTYWIHDLTKGGTGDDFYLDGSNLYQIDLTYLGNLSDLEKVPRWNREYYDDADVVDMNHRNTSAEQFYVRKGAKRSAVKMLETARYKIEREESAIRSSQHSIERLKKAVAQIEAGNVDVHV